MYPDDFSAGAIPADGQPGAGQQQPQDPPGNREPAAGTEPPASPDGATGAQQDGSSQAPKTFTQAELDKVVQSEKAKAEARAERRVLRILEKQQGRQQAPAQAATPAAGNQQQSSGKPTPEQYGGNTEAYVDALTDWKLEQRDQQQQADRQQSHRQSIAQKTERFYADAAKIDGFDREAFDDLELTPHIVQAMLDSDVAPQLMALMAESPDEVARIAKLAPARQAAEIGKLELKAVAKKPRPSNAPAPITPIAGGEGGHSGDPSRMSQDEYIAMRKKQGAAWALRGG